MEWSCLSTMDLFSRFIHKSADCQLVVGLGAHRLKALLFKSEQLVGQQILMGGAPETALQPLLDLLKKHQCKRPEITIVLSDHCYQQTQIDKPKVPESEIHLALAWSVKDLMTIEPDNMQLDYYDLPSTSSAQRINVVAADKQWLQEWIRFFAGELNGQMRAILVEELSLINLLADETAPVLLLWQKPDLDVSLLLVHQHALYLSRSLRGTVGLGDMQGELLAEAVDNMSLEVQRALDYFESNLRQPPVRQILLMIDGSRQEPIKALMAANLSVPIEIYSHPKFSAQQMPEFVLSLPLLGAMQPMEQWEVGV